MSAVAQQRATMPAGAERVLDRRSLEKSNKGVLSFLKEGMSVLDVGCGTGAITRGFVEKIGPGKVTGVDINESLIHQAREHCLGIDNISFHCSDIHEFQTTERFDLITSARTLQWTNSPVAALKKMKTLLKPGGMLSILDYNHEKITWTPAPPQSMKYFYSRFIAWREDAGMNNRIADELEHLMADIGLVNISVSDQSEGCSASTDADFREEAGIWLKVAETRGEQMVRDQYVTDAERLQAIDSYQKWLDHPSASMKMYLLSVNGYLQVS